MTTTQPAPTQFGTTSPALPASESGGRVRVRRQPKWIAAGILAICLGGLGGSVLYSSAVQSHSVAVVSRPVVRGAVIAEGDLRSVQVGAIPDVSSVPSAEIPNLIGQKALVDLVPGAMLAGDSVGIPVLPGGRSQVGLKLSPGRVPSGDLAQGTVVALVPLEDPRVAPGAATTLPDPVPATVLTPPRAGFDGATTLLDVQVDSRDAATVANLAANDRLVLVKEGGR